MAINQDIIKKLKADIDKKDDKSSKTKNIIWKPTGKHVIRIVPSQFTPDNPFIALKFHYQFGPDKMNYLSPSSFGRRDPVIDLSNELKRSGNKEKWVKGKRMEPKIRTFVPVIVRGEEEKGVRYWGFGATVYKQLLDILSDPEYGDISDLKTGTDINIEFVPVEEGEVDDKGKKKFPTTGMRVKRNQSPAIDPANEKASELLSLITTQQPKITDVYEEPSFDTLASVLEASLKSSRVVSPVADDDDGVTLPSEEEIAKHAVPTKAPAKQVVNVASPTATKAAKTGDTAEMTEAFENLFNA